MMRDILYAASLATIACMALALVGSAALVCVKNVLAARGYSRLVERHRQEILKSEAAWNR